MRVCATTGARVAMVMLGWLALWSWPVVGIVLFRKYSLPVALCATLIGGYLLLPQRLGVDLPFLPRLSKYSIPTLTALVLTAVTLAQQGQTRNGTILRGWLPRHPVLVLFVAMLVFGVFGTALTNQDTLVYGSRRISGLALYDGFSLGLFALMLLVPMFLARKVLGSHEGQKVLLFAILISALVYSMPAMWEVRMSPQLHRNFYGFTATSFLQQIRNGGFRPVVFLSHGLELGIYLTFAVIAAAALFRLTTGSLRNRFGFAALWLMGVLILAKSLGALVIAVIMTAVLFFFKPRTQMLIAAVFAGIVLTFPLLRTANLVPIDTIVSLAENVSAERASSLKTRLYNENALLDKASDRPFFGWGSWGRNRIYDEDGRDASITDGAWIIELGTGGWVRYIALFGFLCWPVIGMAFTHRDKIDPVCAALALILTAKLLDLIPNSGFPTVIWLVAGSLLGRLEMNVAALHQHAQAPPDAVPDRTLAYRRKPLREDSQGAPQPKTASPYTRQRAQPAVAGAGAEDTIAKPRRYTRTGQQTRYRR